MENLFKSSQRTIKDYTTINYKGEESDHGTYAMVEIPVNDKKNLLFSLHVKTVFYKDNEVLDYLYTKDYPEDCEIHIPEGTTKIKTLYHREENDIFNIQECDKTDSAIKRMVDNKNQNILISSNKKIYVDDYGFVSDGKTDNSEALLLIEDIINNNSTKKDNNYTIIFGSGKYLFTNPHLNFLKHKEGNCVWGLDIKGQGASTSLIYNPNKIDNKQNCFMYNSNNYGSITISDMIFGCMDNKNVTFLKQIADPYSQHVTLNRVTFNNVDYTFDLKGSDCNSEFSINDCKWRGKCKSVLNATKPGLSVQFLNYWFTNPDFQCYSGSFINMEKGGNISIKNGNFIHKSTDGSHKVEGGTFFKLGLNGGDSQQLGICRFNCEGARFECNVARNSNIIESNWGNNASINFISCDDTAMTKSGYNNDDYKNLEECKFVCTKGIPNIKFQDCMIHGKHTYDLSKNTWNSSINMNSVEYDNCLFGGDLNTPYDFINIIGVENENVINPSIRFSNLNKKFSAYEGTLYNENNIQGIIRQKKYMNIKTARGVFPIINNKDNCKTMLPNNSLVTGVILYASKEYSSGTNINNIEIYLGEEDNKIILLKVDEGIEKDGLNYKIELDNPILVNNDSLRTVTFTRDSKIPAYGKENEIIALVEFI